MLRRFRDPNIRIDAAAKWRNLLDSDGNFPVDSNADGLADGWATYNTTGVFETNEQEIIANSENAGHDARISILYAVKTSHKYLITTKIKSSGNGAYGELGCSYKSVSGSYKSFGSIKTNSETYQNLYVTGIIESLHQISPICLMTFGMSDSNSNISFVGAGEKIKIKESHLFDLTAMGNLNPALADYYGVTRYDELTDQQSYECWLRDTGGEYTLLSAGSNAAIELENRGRNLFNKVFYENKYIKVSTGDILTGTGYMATDFIPCKPNTLYSFSHGAASGSAGIAFYDSSKNYISGNSWGSYSIIPVETTPENACYFRCSPNILAGVTLENFIISEGALPETYIPSRTDKLTYTPTSDFYGRNYIDSSGIHHILDTVETVTMAGNSGTTVKAGNGVVHLLDTLESNVYEGTITGTTITTTDAPDGDYTVYYGLATPETEDTNRVQTGGLSQTFDTMVHGLSPMNPLFTYDLNTLISSNSGVSMLVGDKGYTNIATFGNYR